MDQQSFNFWCNQYVIHVGCQPLSPMHLYDFIQIRSGIKPSSLPPIFIPPGAQPLSFQPLGVAPKPEKNKKHCPDGMTCKNVYCPCFHHPSADLKIFLRK